MSEGYGEILRRAPLRAQDDKFKPALVNKAFGKENAGKKPALGKNRESEIAGGGLDFSVGVGANFAVEVNFFVLRLGPFHG